MLDVLLAGAGVHGGGVGDHGGRLGKELDASRVGVRVEVRLEAEAEGEGPRRIGGHPDVGRATLKWRGRWDGSGREQMLLPALRGKLGWKVRMIQAIFLLFPI